MVFSIQIHQCCSALMKYRESPIYSLSYAAPPMESGGVNGAFLILGSASRIYPDNQQKPWQVVSVIFTWFLSGIF